MKKRFMYFLSGFLVALIMFSSIGVYASGGLNQTIDVIFNNINLKTDGLLVASSGESYVLDNGDTVPYSILYKGTTYLPIRRLSEMFDRTIAWDGTTDTISLDKITIGTLDETPIGHWAYVGKELYPHDDIISDSVQQYFVYDGNELNCMDTQIRKGRGEETQILAVDAIWTSPNQSYLPEENISLQLNISVSAVQLAPSYTVHGTGGDLWAYTGSQAYVSPSNANMKEADGNITATALTTNDFENSDDTITVTGTLGKGTNGDRKVIAVRGHIFGVGSVVYYIYEYKTDIRTEANMQPINE